VVLERLFDGLVMLLFVFVTLPFAPLPAGYDVLVVDVERGTLTHITPEIRQELPLPAVRLLKSGCRCFVPE
jgi:hypothetical protein